MSHRRVAVIRMWLAIVAGCGVSFLTSNAQAQSDTRGSAMQQGQSDTRQGRPTFESRFWNYLQSAKYQNWAPGPGQGGDLYAGESPHGAFLKVYMNRKAIANLDGMPNGAIIVKENFGPDQQTLGAITVMYLSTGYNTEHADWYWVKYNPDGTVAMKGDMRLAGKLKGCIDCHAGAGGDDYLFVND